MVICEPPRGQDPYGTSHNPVSLRLKWQSPGYALQCIYDMSQQPALMNQLWRQAWPESLWSDLLADGLSEVWPVTFTNYDGYEETSLLYIDIAIEIASDEKLCLPWDWLARCLLYAPAASLTYYLNASGPLALQQQDKDTMLACTGQRKLIRLSGSCTKYLVPMIGFGLCDTPSSRIPGLLRKMQTTPAVSLHVPFTTSAMPPSIQDQVIGSRLLSQAAGARCFLMQTMTCLVFILDTTWLA